MKWIAPFGSSDPDAQYVNAQPLVAGSNPPAAFFNIILNELLAVIIAADMEPTDESMHQIADAIVYLTERAAMSGVVKGAYWFGKTTANFSVPAPTIIGQNYIDFTTLKTYVSNDGSTWTESATFVPPVGIDFTILITSKFWDIPEQTDQQGGSAVFSHSTETWAYWPKIVNLDNVVHLAGTETITGDKTLTGETTIKHEVVGKKDADATSSDVMLFQLSGRDSERIYTQQDCFRRGTIGNTEWHQYVLNQSGARAEFSISINDAGVESAYATTGIKSAIGQWVMPNYSAGVAVPWNTDTIMPCHGLVVMSVSVDSAHGMQLYVNDVKIFEFINGDSLGIKIPLAVYVAKGDKIRAYSSRTGSCVYYPLKV